ncbi:MAG: ECF-type sigma factor [Planctomycetaceae bacterium]
MTDNQATSFTVISGNQTPSVSDWVRHLKDGDADAAQQLWNRYFQKLVVHAGQRVRAHNCPEGTVVPEDVAASVFESLWKGANAGRFQKVTDRDELWWLLQAMTRRKVVSHIRHATARQRFSGQVPASLSHDEPGSAYRELMSDEPDAEYVVMMQDQFSRLLSLLRDDKLRQIAVLKLEGCSNDEICRNLSISSATTTRKLRLIRETWQLAIDEESSDNGKL